MRLGYNIRYFFVFFLCAFCACSSSKTSSASRSIDSIAGVFNSINQATVINSGQVASFVPSEGSVCSQVSIDLGADYRSSSICAHRSIFGLSGEANCFTPSEISIGNFSGASSSSSTSASYQASPGSAYGKITLDLGRDYISSSFCGGKKIFGLDGGASCYEALNPTLSNRSQATSSTSTTATLVADSGSVYKTVTVELGADYQATNICSSRSIFGLSGSGICGSLVSSSASSLSQGASRTDTQATYQPAANQFFSQFTVILGSSFLATNICALKTIFGLSGTATCYSVSSQTFNQFNNGALSNDNKTATFTAGSGFAYNQVTVALGADYKSSNICSTKTIFGVPGYASCQDEGSSSSLTLSFHRIKGTAQVLYSQLMVDYATTSLPTGSLSVPDLEKNDDGYLGTSIDYAPRPTADCGVGKGTLTERISDCSDKNGINAVWTAKEHGNAGQADWTLVTRSGANNEVWQDSRTGLFWSSLLPASVNWCQANGNVQTDDPNGLCNTASYQPEVAQGIARSACEETGTAPAIVGDGDGTGAVVTWNGSYLPAKGGMGGQSTPAIKWRQPTLYDYSQAEIDGIRFVMPDMGMGRPDGSGSPTVVVNEWTATVMRSDTSRAFVFDGRHGGHSTESRSGTSLYTRCVGY